MPIFVVHEHHARTLHWDLRLKANGVLKSWALPKEPPTRQGIRRLAIQVEDHPLSYADFEGEIKEGYGKGTVKIWDIGTYETTKKGENSITFILNGHKLHGEYVLFKIKENWLFFKKG